MSGTLPSDVSTLQMAALVVISEAARLLILGSRGAPVTAQKRLSSLRQADDLARSFPPQIRSATR